MKMRSATRRVAVCLVLGLLVVAISACGGRQAGSDEYDGDYAAAAFAGGEIAVPDPERAIEAIYQSLEGGSVDRVSDEDLSEVFGLAPYMVLEAVAYVSEVSRGLRDIAIVRPAPDMEEQAREALNQYAASRAAAFRNYDILGSYSIASGAVVFNQGEHLVMLMLPDNDAAREILNQYLPS